MIEPVRKIWEVIIRKISDQAHPSRRSRGISAEDKARWIQDRRTTIEKLRGSTRWQDIPSIIDLLACDEDPLRIAATETLVELVAHIPTRELAELDERLRDCTLTAYHWQDMNAAKVAEYEWPARVWCLFAMHPSGYVRQLALGKIASENLELSLPFFLLCANDWVASVRDYASSFVRGHMTIEHVSTWALVADLVPRVLGWRRMDLRWLTDGMEALFVRPEGHLELRQLMQSCDRATARWAFRIALKVEEAAHWEFVALAMKCRDNQVRLWAARSVRQSPMCDVRERLLEAMRDDSDMPVRKEWLYAAAAEGGEERERKLCIALLDRHPSMRHAARVYLQGGSLSANALDAAVVYRNMIPQALGSELKAAIAGLGECGTKDDVKQLAPFVGDGRASVAAAAVQAIWNLDKGGGASWLIQRLGDQSSGAAKQAALLLGQAHIESLVGELRRIARSAQWPHSRRLALRLLVSRRNYEALADALSAIVDTDGAVAGFARLAVHRIVRERSQYEPTIQELEMVRGEMDRAAVQTDLRDLVEGYLRGVRGRRGGR